MKRMKGVSVLLQFCDLYPVHDRAPKKAGLGLQVYVYHQKLGTVLRLFRDLLLCGSSGGPLHVCC